jgi:hypothetical protein
VRHRLRCHEVFGRSLHTHLTDAEEIRGSPVTLHRAEQLGRERTVRGCWLHPRRGTGAAYRARDSRIKMKHGCMARLYSRSSLRKTVVHDKSRAFLGLLGEKRFNAVHNRLRLEETLMQGAFKLGTFGGIDIRLHYTWLFALNRRPTRITRSAAPTPEWVHVSYTRIESQQRTSRLDCELTPTVAAVVEYPLYRLPKRE